MSRQMRLLQTYKEEVGTTFDLLVCKLGFQIGGKHLANLRIFKQSSLVVRGGLACDCKDLLAAAMPNRCYRVFPHNLLLQVVSSF